MTEQQFEDFTNLYLDNEIGRNELRELKDAIRHNVLRRRKFERACEIHQAARKALTARVGEAANARDSGQENRAGASCLPVAHSPSTTKHGLDRPHGRRPWVSGSKSNKQKQSHAHRNASVATLAERQLNQGAASEVDLAKIRLEAPRAAKSNGGGPQIFSFFDSTLGMVIGVILTTFAAAGLYFALKITLPEQDADGESKASMSAIHQSDVIIDPKVLKELSADKKFQPDDDQARAHIFQAALARQPDAIIPSANDYALTQNTATARAAPAGLLAASVALPAPSNVSPPSPSNPGPEDLSPSVILGAQGANALPPNENMWVQLSMPNLLPPAPALDDPSKPANQTTMPVTLP